MFQFRGVRPWSGSRPDTVTGTDATDRPRGVSIRMTLLYKRASMTTNHVAPRENAMSPNVLGQFEHQVLLAILRHGSESYSVDIVEELERETGREVATSAVFVALKRLEAKELVVGRLVPPGPEGGHARRYFSLTEAALDAMRESRQGDGLQLVVYEREDPVHRVAAGAVDLQEQLGDVPLSHHTRPVRGWCAGRPFLNPLRR